MNLVQHYVHTVQQIRTQQADEAGRIVSHGLDTNTKSFANRLLQILKLMIQGA